MTITEAEYFKTRADILNNSQLILDLERKYMDFLVGVTLAAASTLEIDFGRANDLLPFWGNYRPKQRGRAPTGNTIPCSEVGEKSLTSNLIRKIAEEKPDITFPGLPFGGDTRFMTENAFIHFDVKLTGPNDNPDEVVAPPQQISGDGLKWQNGILNTSYPITGEKTTMTFQPKLPPFYILEGKARLCLTYFLKTFYTLTGAGMQPLHSLEVACVPSGLLLYDGPWLARTAGLLIPGKDDKTIAEEDKRIRVRLYPLSSIASWRCQQIVLRNKVWVVQERLA